MARECWARKFSIVAGSQFANPAQGDFTLASDSPALQRGFRSFDYRQAGVYAGPAWRAKANGVTHPPLEIVRDPPK